MVQMSKSGEFHVDDSFWSNHGKHTAKWNPLGKGSNWKQWQWGLGGENIEPFNKDKEIAANLADKKWEEDLFIHKIFI